MGPWGLSTYENPKWSRGQNVAPGETLNQLWSYKEPRTGIIGRESEISPCGELDALVRRVRVKAVGGRGSYSDFSWCYTTVGISVYNVSLTECRVRTSKNIYRWWMKNKLHAKVREKICTLYWQIQTLLPRQALLNNRHKAEQIVQNNKSNWSPLRDCQGTFYPLLYWCPPGVLHQWLITSHICPPPVWQQLPL